MDRKLHNVTYGYCRYCVSESLYEIERVVVIQQPYILFKTVDKHQISNQSIILTSHMK